MDLKFIQIGAGPANILGEAVWIIIGLITIFAGIKNLLDKENPSRQYFGALLALYVRSVPGFRQKCPVRSLLLCVCRRFSSV